LGAYPHTYLHEGAFPPGFAWGLGTAAYQIEGAWSTDGRGPSIWDDYSGASGAAPNPQMVARGPVAGASGHDQSGAVACDHYHRFRDDVRLMASLGVRHYRFSVAWPRLLPNGTLAGGVNAAGLRFYDELIDALLGAGITPFITLYHWDLPSALQTEAMPGWLDRSIVGHFVDFASLCFRRWGDKVRSLYILRKLYFRRWIAAGSHTSQRNTAATVHSSRGSSPHAAVFSQQNTEATVHSSKGSSQPATVLTVGEPLESCVCLYVRRHRFQSRRPVK